MIVSTGLVDYMILPPFLEIEACRLTLDCRIVMLLEGSQPLCLGNPSLPAEGIAVDPRPDLTECRVPYEGGTTD